ncbi:hypothetical protein [Chitinivorax sp. B]|uniref:hypothetical protein n=1 Tax=Chitinivorax sp. B TaxID=2502235 RepID=UPI0010F5B576|nr:hypothetical protein [Chitinivorax sp. B]
MNKDQRALILDLSLGKISKDKFLRLFSGQVEMNGSYLCDELHRAFLSKDADDIEHLLLLGFQFGIADNCSEVLCKLILEGWHMQHENIAMILKELKSPNSVDYLYQAALASFPYLDYDESYALGVKCIYALRAIGTSDARERLLSLASGENKTLAENAKRLLKTMAV